MRGADPSATPSFLPDRLAGPLSALLYGIVSISMGFFNKAVLSVYRFNYPTVMLTLQMLVALLIVALLRALNVMEREPLHLAKAKQLAPIAFLYSANVAFGLASLSKLNVPMYNTLKRMTPMVVVAINSVLTKKPPKHQVVLAVAVTTAGSFVAGIGDISFDVNGYICAGLSCMLQATYLVAVQRTGAEKGLSSATILMYNSLLSLPPLLILTLLDGSLRESTFLILQSDFGLDFHVAMLGSLIIGVLLNYTLFLCTQCNSALTTTIVGIMKGVISTMLGFFLLGGTPLTGLNLAGITVNTVGGTWYSYIKYQDKQKPNAKGGSTDAGLSRAGDGPHIVVDTQLHPDSLVGLSPRLRPVASP